MRPILTAFAALALLSAAACEKPAETPIAAPVEPAAEAPPLARPGFEIDPAIPMDADSIADGRNIAETHCAICHGLDQDASLRADAPPLRYVLSIYPPDSLAEDFRNGIHVGHEDMPEFVFGDLGMDVLLAYLISIQETPPGE
jgi:mono/diheme cytochrome c family protein